LDGLSQVFPADVPVDARAGRGSELDGQVAHPSGRSVDEDLATEQQPALSQGVQGGQAGGSSGIVDDADEVPTRPCARLRHRQGALHLAAVERDGRHPNRKVARCRRRKRCGTHNETAWGGLIDHNRSNLIALRHGDVLSAALIIHASILVTTSP
jgi:hypothetical protein